MKNVKLVSIIGFLALLVITATSVFITIYKTDNSLKYEYIAPRVNSHGLEYSILNFVPLRDSIEQYLQSLDSNYSFYFEYLPTGTSIQSSNTGTLPTASLLKVPIAMDAYKLLEEGLIDFETKHQITAEILDNSFIGSKLNLSGESINLEEAIENMLMYSDNTSLRLLEREISSVTDENVPYTVVDVTDLDYDLTEYTKNNETRNVVYISSKEYSSLLKCLYFSCYLTEEHSNHILDLMTKSVHTSRLAVIASEGIKVAHKIGVINDEVQSDCGVIFHPTKPYLVCLLLEATRQEGDEYISHLSRMIYVYIDNYNNIISELND